MTTCPFEDRVAAAARHGRWDDGLADHRDQCPSCAETALVTAALASLEDSEPLPDSRALWLRARHDAREQAMRRAMWPIALAHRLGWITAASVAIAFAPRLLELGRQELAGLSTPDLSQLLPAALSSPLIVLVATAAVLAGLIAVEATVSRPT